MHAHVHTHLGCIRERWVNVVKLKPVALHSQVVRTARQLQCTHNKVLMGAISISPGRQGAVCRAKLDTHLQRLHPHVVALQQQQPRTLDHLWVLLCRQQPLHHRVGTVLDRELTPRVTLRLQRIRAKGGELQKQGM
jgi:hypothetical protein